MIKTYKSNLFLCLIVISFGHVVEAVDIKSLSFLLDILIVTEFCLIIVKLGINLEHVDDVYISTRFEELEHFLGRNYTFRIGRLI